MNTPANTLLAQAQLYASKGVSDKAFEYATEALLARPGDTSILNFIAGLNYTPKVPPALLPAAQASDSETPAKNAAELDKPTPDFNAAAVHEWPEAYFGGHPQRYEHNYPKYVERGGLVKPGIDVHSFTSVTGKEEKNRRSDMGRYYFFCLVFDQIVKEGIPGNFAELGVDKGHVAGVLATFARRIGTNLYLLDTFEGFSPKDFHGVDADRKIEFSDTSLESVRASIGEDNVQYIKGYFPESAAQMPADLRFSLVHIDCDLYAPALSALKYFYPRMAPGGFIVIHDYNSLFWDGAENAVDEFFSDKPESVIPVPDASGSVVIRKSKLQATTPAGEPHAANAVSAVDMNEQEPQPAQATQCWCGGTLSPSVHSFYGTCDRCGTQVLTHAPTEAELEKYYSLQGYWHEHQQRDCGFPNIEKRAEEDKNDRIPVWHSLLKQAGPAIGSLLEIGCAHGGFLHYCREHGVKEVVGIEVDEATCKFARERFGLQHVCAGLFPNVKLPFEKFDAIAAFDVIEHFPDPVSAVRHIAALLSENGVFLFQTPCYRGENDKWSQFKPAEHIYLYNGESVKALFDGAGLEVTNVLPGYFPDDMFVIGRVKGATPKPPVRISLPPALAARRIVFGADTHSAEGTMRWLGQRAEIVLPPELLESPATLQFSLGIGDLWCYGRQQIQTTVFLNDRPMTRLSFTHNQQSFTLALPLEASATPQRLVIESSTGFVPAQIDAKSKDQRNLAVKLNNLCFVDNAPVAENSTAV